MQMRITFIRPHIYDSRSSDAMQPLVFAVLASLTPPEHELVLYDEKLEPIDFEHETDLVALTVDTFSAKRAYEIAHHFRKRGTPVVLGGYHPSLIPEESSRFADAVVIGDAEGQWQRVLQDVQKGELQPIYSSTTLPPMDGRIPDRSIFKGKKYTRLLPVYYGRGCRFACGFCSIHSMYKSNLRQRPLDTLVEEIEALGSKTIVIVDDNIYINRTVTEEFLKAITPLKIDWVGQISLDIGSDLELLDLIGASGCVAMQIGFESLTSDNLAMMRKKWNVKYGEYKKIIREFQARGIMIYGSFIMGYDHDTPASFDITADFAIENKFCLANFSPLTPLPGTKIYSQLKEEGRLIYDRWWLDPSYRYGEAIFEPKGMTADQLTEGCYRARTKFNTYASIVKRSLEPNSNARKLKNYAIYWIANLINRKEVHKKQLRPLGDNKTPYWLAEGT
jgi:radical SAM superfamily enzyme YgiQ (UPF0313 family)